jgi:lipopolysaccharide export system permease protein
MAMMRRVMRPLDRYVLREFTKIFIATAVGLPLFVIIIDLTDNLDKYLNRNLPSGKIAMSYLYWVPDSMFMALPAAVLFATVFTIGGLTRHSEITAAKASGMSFHRLVFPIFLASVLISVFAAGLGELVPVTNRRRAELLEERKFEIGADRFNFAYASPSGRIYKVGSLSADRDVMEGVDIERKGRGEAYPSYVITARTAAWDSVRARWMLRNGNVHILPDSVRDLVISFDSLRDNRLRETPEELTAKARSPQEMRYKELGRYIRALERSGADVNELKVEHALKLAVPITCLIIAIFGAPLATSTQRGGAAYGIGISLATTVFFLMLIQITKAVGGGGLLPPLVAAWVPNVVFGAVGLFFLLRTRT